MPRRRPSACDRPTLEGLDEPDVCATEVVDVGGVERLQLAGEFGVNSGGGIVGGLVCGGLFG